MYSSLTKLRLLISSPVLFACLLLLDNPLAVSAEVAQPSAPKAVKPSAPETEEPSDSKAVMEHIVVTGSRIRRDAFSSPAPIQVITTDRADLAGLLSATDILHSSTIAAGQQVDDSFSGIATSSGPGANKLSLRGLGGQRSLVLVNGRRWVPSGVRGLTNGVDLTSLPASLISRYEVLKDGASSVYGADAIAGVVNAITRATIDGGDVQLNASAPETGGGQRYRLSGAFGRVGDNWHLNFGASFYKQRELVRAKLDYGHCRTRPRLTDRDADGNIDNLDPATGEPLCFNFLYGAVRMYFRSRTRGRYIRYVRYEPSLANPEQSNPYYDSLINGRLGVPNFTRLRATPLDNSGGYLRDARSADIAHVVTEKDTISLSSNGAYDFTLGSESATAYYELYFNRRETRANGGYRQYAIWVPSTNPYNPFNRRVGPILPTYEIRDPNQHVEIDRANFFSGLKGDLTETWHYDVYVGAGHSSGEYRSHVFLDDQSRAANDAILDKDGNPSCRDKDLETYPDCVPANLFTEEALLYGRLPKDLVRFITKHIKGTTEYQGFHFSGYATGEVFAAPAGPASLVLGLEARYESIDDQPDEESQAGNIYNTTAAGRTQGSDTVREAFAELEVPLLSGYRFTQALVVNASGRVTDYRSYGSDFTWRLGVNWQIVPLLKLRGTAGTSFRAPALYEQFLADQTGYVSASRDPCINALDEDSPLGPGDPEYDNCVSLNLPARFGQSAAPSIVVKVGGADTLEPETSDAWTLGLVLKPQELDLSIGVTWFDIKIKDTVSRLSSSTILRDCYESVGFSSPLCSRIAGRDSDGFLTGIDATFVNIGERATAGADLDFLYEHEFASFDFEVHGSFTYISKHDRELLGQRDSLAGRFANPRWKGEVDLQVDYRNWRFFWRVKWIDSTAEDEVYDRGTTNVSRVTSTDSEFYHTASIRYRRKPWNVILAVRNVLDEDPPIVADGSGTSARRIFNTIPGAGYPLLGRTYSLRVGYRF